VATRTNGRRAAAASQAHSQKTPDRHNFGEGKHPRLLQDPPLRLRSARAPPPSSSSSSRRRGRPLMTERSAQAGPAGGASEARGCLLDRYSEVRCVGPFPFASPFRHPFGRTPAPTHPQSSRSIVLSPHRGVRRFLPSASEGRTPPPLQLWQHHGRC
jgi:hypothetical protein